MNNKGMTLVELIVTFSLLMIIIVGMFNLIMDVKGNLDDKKMAKELTEYSSTIGNQIQYDLIRKSVWSIGCKNSAYDNWTVLERKDSDANIKTLTNKNDEVQFDFCNNSNEELKNSIALDKMCKNIFPCVVYSYEGEPDLSEIGKVKVGFETIAINIPETINPSGTLEEKLGIYYDGVFEALPYQENVDMSLPKSSEDSEYVSLDENIFSMNIPIKIVDQEGNNGFKVVKLFSVEQVK